jgi:hypothetical protein
MRRTAAERAEAAAAIKAAWTARHAEKLRFARDTAAATAIQAAWRGAKARADTATQRWLRSVAAVTIQGCWRAALRRRARELAHARANAAAARPGRPPPRWRLTFSATRC